MNYDTNKNDHDHDDVNPDDGGGGDCGDHHDDLYLDRYFNSNWILLCMSMLVKDISVCNSKTVKTAYSVNFHRYRDILYINHSNKGLYIQGDSVHKLRLVVE